MQSSTPGQQKWIMEQQTRKVILRSIHIYSLPTSSFHSLIWTFDNLLNGSSTLGCTFVIIPVTTVTCPSRMVNACPLFITIFFSMVKRTFPCSPGISISLPPTEREFKSQIRIGKNYELFRWNLRISTRHGILQVWLYSTCVYFDTIGLCRPPSLLASI